MTDGRCLIAFDAAGRACSAAVLRGQELLAGRQEPMTRGQAERLVPMIEEVLAEAGVAHADLDALAVTVGPGAFTGVRIGLAAARGYALALGIPQIGVTCFEAVAQALSDEGRADRPLLVLLDAKRQDLYAQFFDREGRAEGDPFTATPEELAARLTGMIDPPLLAGDGVEQLRPALDAAEGTFDLVALPVDASAVGRAAADKPLPPAGTAPPAPLYLRPPDVSQPKAAMGAKPSDAARPPD